MQQMINVIRLDEGGVSTPYIVHHRISQFSMPTLPEGFRLIREQRGNEAYHLVCEPIKDAVWEDIPTEEPKQVEPPTPIEMPPPEVETEKGQNVDTKA